MRPLPGQPAAEQEPERERELRALSPSDLAGTWRLRCWELEAEDGRVEHPFGQSPRGIVVYTLEGHMITTIARSDRVTGGPDLLTADEATRRDAVGSFIAYSGTFTTEQGDVLHQVEMSLEPAWVGTLQRRHVRVSDDGQQLTLSTDPLLVAGRRGRHRLTWERSGAAAHAALRHP